MRMSVKSVLLVAVALSATVSCTGDFNTSRPPAQKTTLGDDIYSTLCDRVGASVLAEDLTGASYHDLCHMAPDGSYADKVDESVLPAVAGAAVLPRKYAIAKLEAMARRRKDLIKALNLTFDDGDIPIPFDNSGKTIKGHAALSSFLQSIVPLYESNPIDPGSEPMMPGLTRSAGRLFAALAGPGDSPYTDFGTDTHMAQIAGDAQKAMANISGRQGYRPLRVTLGAIRPMLAYPELRELAQTLVPELGPGGPMHDALQNVLGAVQKDLADSTAVEPKDMPSPYQLTDPAKLQPNRARTDMEVVRAILLAEDPAFEAVGAQSEYLVRRDLRGFALPAPGQTSIEVDPFGRAKVDGLGRFFAPGGTQLADVDPPFVVPGFPRVFQPDQFGRALVGGKLVYQYIDTSKTFGASAMRDLAPLLDPDPADKHETVTDLLAGAYKLFGDRVSKDASWAVGGKYQAFDGNTSPLTDLLYATGQLLADKDSDATLQMFKQLMTEHQQVVARVIGAALKVREISNQFPNVKLDPKDTFWDEMAQEVVKIAKDPALFKDVMRALEDPNVQQYAGTAFGNYSAYRDALTYDPNNVFDGAALNLTDGGNSHADPHNPVDYSAPDTGMARSDFHRILQIIHDVDGVTACNKAGAKVQTGILGTSWPLFGSYKECELFVFQNMGVLYLQSILGKAKMTIRDGTFNGILNLVSGITSIDQLFQSASGIKGMTLSPTPQALNRLVFFGADGGKYGSMPDLDTYAGGKNKTTNTFISTLIDPVSTSVCPTRAVQDPKGQLPTLHLADCSLPGGSKNDLLRIRDHGTIFLWERFNFYAAMKPLLKAFDDHNADPLFLELMETLYRHWPSAAHSAAECTHTGTWIKGQPNYNPKYCAESGLSHYDPILAQAFKTDLLPALGELVKTLDNMTVQDPRNGTTHSGLDLLHEATQVLFDPAYASSIHLTDRQGNVSTTWADGKTPEAQVTLFDLFARAMREIDQKLDGDPRQTRFHNARSQLVDTFLSVDGSGTTAAFHNKAVPKALPILIDVLRAQLNAHCPTRETDTTRCKWATQDFAQEAADNFSSPVFATTMDLLDQINQDPNSRRQLEKLLHYLLEKASTNDALRSTMTSLSDMMQLLSDDVDMPPIYNAVSLAAAPANQTVPNPDCNGAQGCKPKPTPGAADRLLEALQTLTSEVDQNGQPAPNPYDRYHVLDRILKNLVTPMDPNDPESMTPIEVFLDTAAEVNRVDASAKTDEPLTAQDYAYAFGSARDFLTSKTRGLEQLYEIVKHRNGN